MSPKSRKRKLKNSKARRSARAGIKPSKPSASFGAERFPVLLGEEFPGELGIKNTEIRAFLNEQYPAPILQACAENIDVLLRQLSIEDNGQYLYRGQTRHFPALVPSMFRRAMIPGTEGDAIIGIDPNQFHSSLSERDKIRFRLLGEMMETYGPSVGNIIAQQYGLGSEALDVTGDPNIAAFFATRQYPEYQPYQGNTYNTQGVIYRFPLLEVSPDLEILDSLYRLACKRIDPFGDVWFVGFQKRAVLTDKILKDVTKIFEERGGTIRAEVRTRPLVVDHGFYEREIRASWSKRLMDEVPPLTDTRLLRQRGGSIRTVSRWVSSISAELEAVKHPNLGFVFSPPFAIGEELIGVENINRYPKLEIFPFTHSAYEIDLSPDYLWPGEESDWMYKHLMIMLENRHFEFLQKQNVSVDDLREGLINRGYQRSTDDAKTRVQ